MNSFSFAVVLSGCGVYDGAEIHEATLTLLAIVQAGASYQCFAPNIEQHHVINHLNGEEMDEKRNVLIESARIARGNITDLKDFNASDFDAIIFPGGFGVAKNLSNFAFKGAEQTINIDVEKSIQTMVQNHKPIGALCISPAIMPKVLKSAKVTIGNDTETIEAIEKMGGQHTLTTHGEIVIDSNYKLITSPCYMLNANIAEIALGAKNVVDSIINMLQNN